MDLQNARGLCPPSHRGCLPLQRSGSGQALAVLLWPQVGWSVLGALAVNAVMAIIR